MLTTKTTDLEPMQRFVALHKALREGEDFWSHPAWWRFAAQAVVLCPEDPVVISKAIHRMAGELTAGSSWFDALRSPLRFVVAAMLVQDDIDSSDFLAEVASARDLFKQEKINRRGIYELLTILTLKAIGGPIDAQRILFLKRIHERMNSSHRWLTGPDDLPACALLTVCPGGPDEIAANAEAIFQGLRRTGFIGGNHLQTAANLLPLTELAPAAAVERYCRLADAFKAAGKEIWYENYDAVAVLSLLEHEPAIIIERFSDIYDQLKNLDPPVFGAADFAVAVDITFLELVRYRHAMQRVADGPALEGMLRLIHKQRAAALVLIGSTIEPTLLDFDWLLPERGI